MDEFVEVLQVNGKGWNKKLFVSNIPDICTCQSCKHICKDAVELGCDHDDTEIDAFCKKCLSAVLAANNNHCPINSSHVNPQVASVRTLRRQILSLKVYCPNGEAYANRSKKNEANFVAEDANIYDTLDEKEGGNVAYKRKENKKQCDWNGTLKELISNHIQNCSAVSDDMIISKINQLKQKVDEIAQKVDVKDKNYNDSFNDLRGKINNLNNVLKQQQKATNDQLSEKEVQILTLRQQVQKNSNLLNNLNTSFEIYKGQSVAKDKQISKLQQQLDTNDKLWKQQQIESDNVKAQLLLKDDEVNKLKKAINDLHDEKKANDQDIQHAKMFMDSKILTNEEKVKLKQMVDKQLKYKYDKWQLLFRATNHGSTGRFFHRYCDGKERTISIIETDTGNVFGGYADVAWQSASPGVCVKDANAFLFLIRSSKKYESAVFNVTQSDEAIVHNRYYPCVFGNSDIVCVPSFKSGSYTSKLNYNIPSKHYLNGDVHKFGVKELETFQLK